MFDGKPESLHMRKHPCGHTFESVRGGHIILLAILHLFHQCLHFLRRELLQFLRPEHDPKNRQTILFNAHSCAATRFRKYGFMALSKE